MSTLQVKGGSGPAGRTLKTLNNKNNLATLYMKKQLEQLHREQTFCISHLDRHRFEVHDFLQQVQRKDSDKHPASIKYLGKAELSEDFDKNKNETPRRQDCRQRNRRHRRVKPERPSTNSETPVHRSSSTLQDPIPRISSEKLIDRQKTFSVPIQKQLLTSTVTPLPSLNGRRESVYFQIASSTAADMSSDSSDGEDDEPTIEVKAKDLSNRRRSSFVAWVQENGADQAKKLKERLYQMSLKDNPLEQRRNSFSKFLKRFKSKKSMTPVESRQLQEISETTSPEGEELQRFNYSYPMDNNQNDMMKSIMLNKERRKIPLDDRIDSFYERLAHLKIPVFNFNDPRPRLTALERRRYTLLTKGLKAALNESSDEED